MLTILLHSSKTMRPAEASDLSYQAPALLHKANELSEYLRTLTPSQLESSMKLSAKKAGETHTLLQSWTDSKSQQRPAIDAFLGDIYSGLQVQSFSESDRAFANEHLLILSGLYGGLRALDSIHPYRLEMGYKLPNDTYANLYNFWGDSIAGLIPKENAILNLSAVEYTRAVLPYIEQVVVTPKFFTFSNKTRQPEFVTVHAKIARGAFAHWIIKNRVNDIEAITSFNELGYKFDSERSSPSEPAFVCSEFGGLGLSVRLT